MTQNQFKNSFFLFVFTIAIALNLYLFSPLFHTFVFAAIITGTFYPLFVFIQKKYKLNKNFAAVLTTLAVVLTVVLPSIYLITQLSRETLGLYQILKQDLSREVVQSFFLGDGYLSSGLSYALDLLELDITKDQVYEAALVKAQSYTGSILKLVNKFLGDTVYFLFQFALMIVAIYGLFISGSELKTYLFKLSPLPEEQEQKILDRFNQMNYVTLVGNGIGGLIQGLLAGVAFAFAGLPSVFLWTTVMIILAFIPLVGISIVFIPACLYLALTGSVTTGIILFIWCVVVSLVVENYFKPKFVGDRLKVNGILLLFYIIAGMSVFGAAGIFYGPILCIVFLTIGEIFTSYYLPQNQV